MIFKWSSMINNRRKEHALSLLHPLENPKSTYSRYKRNRRKIVIITVVVNILIWGFIILYSKVNENLEHNTYLRRNDYGNGDYCVDMQAVVGDVTHNIEVLVREKQLTQDEMEQMIHTLQDRIPLVILGRNKSLDFVNSDLNLVSTISGIPVKINWESSNPKRINIAGKVFLENMEAVQEKVVLTASFQLCGERKYLEFPIVLQSVKPSIEKIWKEVIYQEIEKNQDLSNQYISLPKEINNTDVIWKERKPDLVIMFLVFTLFLVILILQYFENNLEKQEKQRQQQIKEDYPAFVDHLRLYLIAGLSVRNTWIHLAQDYKEQRKKQKRFIYEELLLSLRQLGNGEMEKEVYKEWGNRCGNSRTKRLSYLLIMQITKGNGYLLELLDKEAWQAQEDQRMVIKKKGEEASTKLLFPMMMMLLIVMFLILLPAWTNMGQIT